MDNFSYVLLEPTYKGLNWGSLKSSLIGTGFLFSFESNFMIPCLKIWKLPFPRSFASNSGAFTSVTFSFGDISFLVSDLVWLIFYLIKSFSVLTNLLEMFKLPHFWRSDADDDFCESDYIVAVEAWAY